MAEPIICPNPNCGYRGEPNLEPRGSTLLLILLLFTCVVPGVLYLLFAGGYRQRCPRCNIDMGVAPRDTRSLLVLLGLVILLFVSWSVVSGRESSRPPAAPTAAPSSTAPSAPGLQAPIPSEQPGYVPPPAPSDDAGSRRRRRHRRD